MKNAKMKTPLLSHRGNADFLTFMGFSSSYLNTIAYQRQALPRLTPSFTFLFREIEENQDNAEGPHLCSSYWVMIEGMVSAELVDEPSESQH